MENRDLVIKDIDSISNINDFLGRFRDDSVVSNYIESITYDVQSQSVIIHMQKLVKEWKSHEGERRVKERDLSDEKIKRLSESYKEHFPVLMDNFKEWKPAREKLVNLLQGTADKLERNSAFVSAFRVLTSAVDIFGTLARADGKPDSSWADFAMEHASTFGLLSLFLEMTISKKMHGDVKKAIKRDQELFKKITQWFKQTEELDCAIKSFFPYGIDENIVKKIARTSSDFDDYNKLFMSIVASNVKKNVNLFKDKTFLKKADGIATSEAGKQWFHKIILENDPYFNHCQNSKLSEEIQDILKISPAEKPELYVLGYRMLFEKVKMKVLLNVMTIISAGSNLLFGNKPEESDSLKELSENTKKELQEIRKAVSFLKPSELELDPVLQ